MLTSTENSLDSPKGGPTQANLGVKRPSQAKAMCRGAAEAAANIQSIENQHKKVSKTFSIHKFAERADEDVAATNRGSMERGHVGRKAMDT